MKLTNLALIFIVILLPMVIIVYVNTQFVLKAQQQEMYYKNLITAAVQDATYAMKQVENEDVDIDYGYSGIQDNKVSVNANLGINTFLNTLFTNFNIKGNEDSEYLMNMYIPVISVLDYDGIYIYSAERLADETKFVLKPKSHYTYTYFITYSGSQGHYSYDIKPIEEYAVGVRMLGTYIYEVNFTMDDYVRVNVYNTNDNNMLVESNSFYLTDSVNNNTLITTNAPMLSIDSWNLTEYNKRELVNKLQELRKTVIAEKCMKEITYAVNAHNTYAHEQGISYNFNLTVQSDEKWAEIVDGIGMIAIVQGISLGNRYLNYTAYGASDLTITTNYYISSNFTAARNSELAPYANRKYYHESKYCPIYEAYLNANDGVSTLTPTFFYVPAEAAANGYAPCPICKP